MFYRLRIYALGLPPQKCQVHKTFEFEIIALNFFSDY